MKFNLKAIAAAAVLAASGSSFAQIQVPTSANPDVYFAAFDQGAQVGFILDTNVGWNTLTSGFSYSFDLDNSAAWNTFRTTAQGNSASTGIQWGVYSAKTGADQGILVGNNAATTSPLLAAANASGVRTGITTMGNSIANAQGNSDNGLFVNGPSVGAVINDTGTFASRLAWNSTELYAQGTVSSQNLFKYTIAAAQTNLLVGSAGIDGGNVLTVAAVPEPGTYALMAAGLIAMGAVVRRRNRA